MKPAPDNYSVATGGKANTQQKEHQPTIRQLAQLEKETFPNRQAVQMGCSRPVKFCCRYLERSRIDNCLTYSH